MNLQTFLEHFNPIAEAPNGIPKLRSLILDLAVRGKLVPQDPGDESVMDLSRKIGDERKKIIEIKKIRENLAISLDDSNIPYKIPTAWIWQRLGNIILDIEAGTSPQCEKRPKDEHEWGVIKISAVSWDEFNPHENKALPVSLEPRKGFEIKVGDFLMSRANTSQLVGKSVIVKHTPPRLLLNDKTLRIHFPACLDKRFFNLCNNSILARQYYAGEGTGTSDSMKNITREQIRNLPIPVPPFLEQKRIVEKVDELMALCDRLQAAKQTRDTLRQKLRGSAIDSLMNAETDEELQKGWAIVRDNWVELSQSPEDVGDLRQVILELAVSGQLVPQKPNGESVEKLLTAVELERVELVENGKLRKSQPSKIKVFDESEFPVPVGWKVVPAENAFLVITDGDHQPPPKSDDGIPFLVIGNVSKRYLDFSQTRFVSQEYFENLDWSKKPKKGDILYTVTGSYGIPLVVSTNQEFCVQRHIAILKTSDSFSKEYLKIALSSSTAKRHADNVATGIAQKTVPLSGLRRLPIPVPPLAEQKRIVAKVDELMQMCDRLEESLRQSQQQAEALAASAIAHLNL